MKLEERYEKYKDILSRFTIMDDIFMRNVLKKKECTEYILQVIMDQKDLYVAEQVIQRDYKNLQYRGIAAGAGVSAFKASLPFTPSHHHGGGPGWRRSDPRTGGSIPELQRNPFFR